jgi:hypothetical protein
LGVLWQLIRLSLLSQINLQQHPEIIALKEASENVKDFVELAPELTLLRWVNHHLRNAGYPRRITNFSADIVRNTTKHQISIPNRFLTIFFSMLCRIQIVMLFCCIKLHQMCVD